MTPHLAIAARPQEEESIPFGSFSRNQIVGFMMDKLPSHQVDEIIIYMQGSLFNPNHYDLPQDKGLSFAQKGNARVQRIKEVFRSTYGELNNIQRNAIPEQEAARLNLPQIMKVESFCEPVRRWVQDGGQHHIYRIAENGNLEVFHSQKGVPTLTLV